MIETRAQINALVAEQLPEFVQTESPLLGEFLKQYYLSQEHIGGPINILENIDQYSRVGTFTTESLIEFTTTSGAVGYTTNIISVKSTDGFPIKYGIVKIDDEIITYTSKDSTKFHGCKRGFSGITSYYNADEPDSLIFESNAVDTHENGSEVHNITSRFLNELFSKLKYSYVPGFEDRAFAEKLNVSNFINRSTDFYRGKGTTESFEILFRSLFGKNVDVIKPQDYLIRPSFANWVSEKQMVVEAIDGDPMDLEGKTIYQGSSYGTVTKVEPIVFGNTTYYQLSLDAGVKNSDIDTVGSIFGEFVSHPKSKATNGISIGSTFVDVDSTVGFGTTGTLRIGTGDNEIFCDYLDKTTTQFTGVSDLTKVIDVGTSIYDSSYAYGYDDAGEQINFRVSNVISGISTDGLGQSFRQNDPIYASKLGADSQLKISDSLLNNNLSKCRVKSVTSLGNNSYELATWEDHLVNLGDEVSVYNGTTYTSLTVTDILDATKMTIYGSLPTFNNDTVFHLRRNILKVRSDSYTDLQKYTGNVLNSYYDDSQDNVYIVSNSLPVYYQRKLSLNDKTITFSGTFDGEDIEIVGTNADHGFYTGDAVYYAGISTTTYEYSNDNPTNTSEVVGVTTETTTLSGLDQGYYFITRVDNNSVKFSTTLDQLFSNEFIDVSGTAKDHKIIPVDYKDKIIDATKIIRKIPTVVDDRSNKTKTDPGPTGVFINGVELLNYKSNDFVYYGNLSKINVLSGGTGYDVINLPEILITDSVGSGATARPNIQGKFERIDIVDPGFDYIGDINVTISGGNGQGAKAVAETQLVKHYSDFKPFTEVSSNSIGFSTYHKFRDGEEVTYKTFSDWASSSNFVSISTSMVENGVYYTSTVDLTTVKLHKTQEEALSGINPFTLKNVGVGSTAVVLNIQRIQSTKKKRRLSGIVVQNPGSGYENKERSVGTIGINTATNKIKIVDHGFSSGDLIRYSVSDTAISGLSVSQDYYVIKTGVDDFRLAAAGIGTTLSNSNYLSKDYVRFADIGAGTHTFKYPPITVNVEGNIGIATTNASSIFGATIQPIVRGPIKSVHVTSGGVGYGVSSIVNYDRQPLILVRNGENSQFKPIIDQGVIKEVVVQFGGAGYTSIPDLSISSQTGSYAELVPVITNGSITSVTVISGGVGYSTATTTIDAVNSGQNATFRASIKTWEVNSFEKFKGTIKDDDGIAIPTGDHIQFTCFSAPRSLRRNVYQLSPQGKPYYGNTDLVYASGEEQLSQYHSPILGWAYDGNPIYGPYGTTNRESGDIIPMTSGYSVDLKAGRPSVNDWPSGFFVEDYTYTADGNLDEHNGRFCRTPEFPNGTYAYFMTINNLKVNSDGPFAGYREPQFPYVIGDTYRSKPETFNFRNDSNTDKFSVSDNKLIRNTKFSKINSDENLYEGLINPIADVLKRKKGILKASGRGSIDSVGILTGGTGYKIWDSLEFDNEGTGGTGAAVVVSEILGKKIVSISSSERSFSDVDIELSSKFGFVNVYTSTPHNYVNYDLITLSGLSTDFFGGVDERQQPIRVVTNEWKLQAGIGTTGVTGISTYLYLDGPLEKEAIREDDILQIGHDSNANYFECLRVLNVDKDNKKVRVLREFNSTTGIAATAGDLVVEKSRKFSFSVGIFTDKSYTYNRKLYFAPFNTVGLGTTAGVGIGSTVSVAGIGTTNVNKFIPTQSMYLKGHGFKTGQKLIYSNGGGTSLGVSTNGIANYLLTDSTPVYAIVNDNNIIGLSTSKVGVGSTGYIGVGSSAAYRLYFHTVGAGIEHSLKTQYDVVTGNAKKIDVVVSTETNPQLRIGDRVNLNVTPGITTTVTIKYNDYHRRVLINPKGIASSGVTTTTNSFNIPSHGFITGDKVLFAATSVAKVSGIPGGLVDNTLYYVIKSDINNFKLASSKKNALLEPPIIVDVTSTGSNTSSSDQHVSLINPPLTFVNGSRVKFDVSDPSLSIVSAGQTIQAFDFSFFEEPKFEDEWFYDKFYTNKKSEVFNVTSVGVPGIDGNASVTLDTRGGVPKILYYSLTPVNKGDLTDVKLQIISDDEVIDYNTLFFGPSKFNGPRNVTGIGSTFFKLSLRDIPEQPSYTSAESEFEYTTTSETAEGSISSVRVKNSGRNYISLPGITTITTGIGSEFNLNLYSSTIGQTVKVDVANVGFDFPIDTTLRPSARLPQILELSRLSIFDSIGILTGGKYYNIAPDIVVITSDTDLVVNDVDIEATLTGSAVGEVEVIKNPDQLYEVAPRVIPINNSNALGITTISWNSTRSLVTVQLDVGFSTAGTFPFDVGDKIWIENVGVNTGDKGFNSEDFGYVSFELSEIDANIGGIGSVSYKLTTDPGTYVPAKSFGKIVPERYIAKFSPNLMKKSFDIGENINKVTSETQKQKGIVVGWDERTSTLRIESPFVYKSGDTIKGKGSKTFAKVDTSILTESRFDIAPLSQRIVGWDNSVGVLNDDLNRVHDSDYYQYFSYALKSQIDLDTWDNPVSALNHTAGYKKFSNLDIISTNETPILGYGRTSSADIAAIVETTIDVNCYSDYDLGYENFIDLVPPLSSEIRLKNTIFTDYFESRGNRVLTIDDVAPQFNHLPSAINWDVIDDHTLNAFRANKFFVFARDTRFEGEKELTIVNSLHDNLSAYLNQYGSVYTAYELADHYDFSIYGTTGELHFYPKRAEYNNYSLDQFSISLSDTTTTGSNLDLGTSVQTSTGSTTITAASSPSATKCVGIGSTYYAGKVLAMAKSSDGEYLFTEINYVHDGSEIYTNEMASIVTNQSIPYDASGIGTFGAVYSGSDVNIVFTAAADLGTTVNTFVTAFHESYVGTGNTSVSTCRIDTTCTGIGSTTSPVPVEIARYSTGTYNAAYYIVGVQDTTTSFLGGHTQLLEAAVVHIRSGSTPVETFCSQYPTIDTNSNLGIGTVGAAFSGTDVVLNFTPSSGVACTVTSIQYAMTHPVGGATTDVINFNNAQIRSYDGAYLGTKTFIKRNFDIKHGGDPVFKKDFGGNDSTIVDVTNNILEIPNHFFVTGEKLTYGNLGIGNTMNIGIDTTTIAGVGTTSLLPETVYAVKINESKIKLAHSATNALATVPTVLDITAVGIGTSHSLTSSQQNSKALIAIDNNIQAPIVGTGVTTLTSYYLDNAKSILYVDDPGQFAGGDVVKIGTEYMKIDSVGVGSTNSLIVNRPWMGSGLTTHASGSIIERWDGDYNIIDDTLNFVSAPIGLSPPAGSGYDGISTSYTFQGRIFLRSGAASGVNPAYYENYVFDNVNTGFNGIGKTFTLTQEDANTTGFSTNGAVVLVNEIFQAPGATKTYTISESSGTSKIIFRGDIATGFDVNNATIPVGGVIVSVGSSQGYGYQPLVAAGGTAIVSAAGTVTSIGLGYTGSGYRSQIPGINTTGSFYIPYIPEVHVVNPDDNSRVAIGTASITDGYITGVAVTNPFRFYAPRGVRNVGYTSASGITTITTNKAHGLSVGEHVLLSGIALTCQYSAPVSISTIAYDNASGIMTVTTSDVHNFSANKDVIFSGLGFTCSLDSGAAKHYYPRGEDPTYDTAVSIVRAGTSHTISNALYNPYTGITTLTVSSHGFSNGDKIRLTDNSLFFTCTKDGDSESHSYPRPTDPISGKWVSIANTTANTFTIDCLAKVGTSGLGTPSTNVTAHTFKAAVAGGLTYQNGEIVIDAGVSSPNDQSIHYFESASSNAIISGGNYVHTFETAIKGSVVTGGNYLHTFVSATDGGVTVTGVGTTTPTNATYNAESGDLILTISDHSYTTSNTVGFSSGAITFSCLMDQDLTNHAYPRATDPILGVTTSITAVSANTITVNVGKTPLTKYDVSNATYAPSTGNLVLTVGVHTLRGTTAHTISTAHYTPTTGIMTCTVVGHGFENGDRVKFVNDSLTFKCAQDSFSASKTYPRSTDPKSNTWMAIAGVTTNTFEVQVLDTIPSTNTGIHSFISHASNGLVKAGESVRIPDNALTFHCAMDSGISLHTYPRPTDPISQTSVSIAGTGSNTITLNVGVSTIVNYSITTATYTASSGIMTMSIGSHNIHAGQSIKIATESLTFTCSKDSKATQHKYPRKPDPKYSGVQVIGVANTTQFTVNVGTSTVNTIFHGGGTVQGSILAPRANNNSSSGIDPGSNGSLVLEVNDDNSFVVNTGISTCDHFYARSGTVSKKYSVEFDDPLSYENIPLTHSSSSPSALGTEAKVNIVVGSGSSVTDFTITNFGYGYKKGEILTIPSDSIAGIPTTKVGIGTTTFAEFTMTVDEIFNDKFAAWSPGYLLPLDSFVFNGIDKSYSIKQDSVNMTIRKAKGSNIDLESTLLIFVNDILQQPGVAYKFNGGNVLEFTETPKVDDTSKLIFYKGSGDADVVEVNILEEVEPGDKLQLRADIPTKGIEWDQSKRVVTGIKTDDTVYTQAYRGAGISSDNSFIRPVDRCKQMHDLIINGQEVAKTRILYEANINPLTPIIKSIGAASTQIFVENCRPFFNNSREDLVSNKQDLLILDRTNLVSAAGTVTVSAGSSVTSITIDEGGSGYTSAPTVVIGIPSTTDPWIPTGSAIGIASTSFGSTGFTTEFSGDANDTSYAIQMQFNIDFFGNTYNMVYVGTNGYITFGGGSSENENITADNPGLPGVHINAGDRRMTGLFYESLPARFRARVTGYNYGSTAGATPLVYEFEMNRGSNIIKLNTVTISTATTSGATNGNTNDYPYTFEPTSGTSWQIYGAPVSRAEENRATATASITAGVVTSVTITNAGTGYTNTAIPGVIFTTPTPTYETIENCSYDGDFGIISGIKTTSIGTTEALVLDLVLPMDSVFRNASIVGTAITVAGIGSAQYLAVSNTNIGYGVTSVDSTGTTVGVGTTFVDNVYEVISVATATTEAFGMGSTAVTQVTVAVDTFNGLTGMGYSEYMGNYSWGMIHSYVRQGSNTYSPILTDGVTGLQSSPVIIRKEILKFTGYDS